MSKSLVRGGAATAFLALSASLIFYTQTLVAEPLASATQTEETQQKEASSAPDAPADAQKKEPLQTAVASSLDGSGASSSSASNGEEKRSARADVAPKERAEDASALIASQSFVATAYSLRGRTASGRMVARGLIAADRKVLPLGTRVRLEAGSYSGEYVVADTGGLVRGKKIDIWMPSSGEAIRFGRRKVKLTVISYGGRRAAVRPAIKVR